jgi:hypothetical protein
MKNSFLLIAFLFSWQCASSQHLFWIDSVRVYPANPTTNDSIHVLIAGKFIDTGVRISNVVTSISTDTVMLDFYETYCSGFNVLVPFDTTVNIGLLAAGNYVIRYRGIIDTNTVDTMNCYIVPGFIPFDSVFVNITVLPTGIESVELQNEIKIFPNPVSGSFTIENRNAPIARIEIYNVLGKIILSSDVHCKSCIVHCEFLPPGNYLIKAIAGEKVLFGKVVKE